MEFNISDPAMRSALLAVAIAVTLYALMRYSGRKKKDPLANTSALTSLSQQRNTERQMQSLLVELAEMSQQISSQLDTRTRKLEMLIEDADQRIATLKQMEQSRATPARVPAEPARKSDDRREHNESPADPQHRQIYALADTGRNIADIARELNRPRGEIELILALRAHV